MFSVVSKENKERKGSSFRVNHHLVGEFHMESEVSAVLLWVKELNASSAVFSVEVGGRCSAEISQEQEGQKGLISLNQKQP